jgi:hypothetical protein
MNWDKMTPAQRARANEMAARDAERRRASVVRADDSDDGFFGALALGWLLGS